MYLTVKAFMTGIDILSKLTIDPRGCFDRRRKPGQNHFGNIRMQVV